MNEQVVIGAERIGRIVRRMAMEIIENSAGVEQLALAGVVGQGVPFAKQLQKEIKRLKGPSTKLLTIEVDKADPLSTPVLVSGLDKVEPGGTVVIVDDVLNTGKTMFYCLAPFVERRWQKVELAVLVERSHHSYPVRATYIGYELATTLEEHIYAFLEPDKEMKVVLR